MMTWVVLEALVNQQRFWAWCLVREGPGFDEVRLTRDDGSTPVDLPEEGLRLSRFLFSVYVEDPGP